MSKPEKEHIIEAFHFEIGKVKDKKIRQAVVDMFNNVDGDLAVEIAKGSVSLLRHRKEVLL